MPKPLDVATSHSAMPKNIRRDREGTQRALEQALLRVTSSGRKLTISAVAKEAGVTPGLIHNTYPDFAEGVRAQMGRSTRQQRDQVREELSAAEKKLSALRDECKAFKDDLGKLASINESLREELRLLRLAMDGKVALFPGR